MSFLDELSKKGIIQRDQLSAIKDLAQEKFGGDIESALVESGVSEEKILAARGEYLKMPIKKVDTHALPFEVLKYIPEDSALHYQFAPIGLTAGILEVGVTDPENVAAMDAIQFISSKLGMPFKIFLISKSDYQAVMNAYRGITPQVEEALTELDRQEEEEGISEENLNKEINKVKGGVESKIVEDAPIIKIVAVILRNAIEGRASDIHIEHTGEKVKVRFRVDGSLHTTITLPASTHSGVIARIKILAKLRLDEKRKPQDGSFSANIDGRKVDFRVSTMPAYYGEKAAIRILDTEKGVRTLDELGLSKRNLEMVREAIKKPYGLILITGPTGSGKSTTLYSMLNELDKETTNIISLEDPVEYHIADINQSQMMPEIGYNFASGLRSILRQDPDVIMVGEIRDKETAQLAIQAALTGHLVLSTLHTNDAIGAVPRLVDMGVDPYLIAPTLILSIAQRLSKQTCPSSRKLVPMPEDISMQIESQLKDLPEQFSKEIKIKKEMYDTVPSPDCPAGTRGRIAVFEMFEVKQEMRSIILKNPVYSEIYQVARKQGMLLMREDAMLKAVDGIIPFQEVYGYNVGGE